MSCCNRIWPILGLMYARELRAYFANRRFALGSYRDDREDFGPGTRAEYFARVPDEALRRAVVFFDPDVGMEPGRATAKHLRFDELGAIQSRMDSASIAVVFQYRRRVADCWELIASQLARRLGCHVAYIAEAVLAFHVIAQTRSRLARWWESWSESPVAAPLEYRAAEPSG